MHTAVASTPFGFCVKSIHSFCLSNETEVRKRVERIFPMTVTMMLYFRFHCLSLFLSFKRLHSYRQHFALYLFYGLSSTLFFVVASMVMIFSPHSISHLRWKSWPFSLILISRPMQQKIRRSILYENEEREKRRKQCEKSFSHLHVNCYRLISNHQLNSALNKW